MALPSAAPEVRELPVCSVSEQQPPWKQRSPAAETASPLPEAELEAQLKPAPRRPQLVPEVRGSLAQPPPAFGGQASQWFAAVLHAKGEPPEALPQLQQPVAPPPQQGVPPGQRPREASRQPQPLADGSQSPVPLAEERRWAAQGAVAERSFAAQAAR